MEGGILPSKLFCDMSKYTNSGRIKPKFSGSLTMKLLLEITKWSKFLLELGNWRFPVRKLLNKNMISNLVLFCSNQVGNVSTKLLSERSMYLKSYWYWRNLGMVPLMLQCRRLSTFNWNFGSHGKFSVSTCNLESWKTSSLEWLANALKGNDPWKWLSNNDRYSRDVRLAMTDNGRFPLNLFEERSRTRR